MLAFFTKLFSRADKAPKVSRALAPAEALFTFSLHITGRPRLVSKTREAQISSGIRLLSRRSAVHGQAGRGETASTQASKKCELRNG
jgi:hypothetical protein